MRFRRLIPILITAVLAFIPVLVAQTPAAAWWSHVVWLADDALKGRAAGTPEHRQAAEYVAAQFEKLGLKPGAGAGYLQPVRLRAISVDPASSVQIVSAGGSRELSSAKEIAISGRGTCNAFEAPLAFVGYGLSVPELGHDDFKDQNLRGKVAVMFLGAPSHLTAALVSHRQGGGERWRLLKRKGAVGIIGIYNPAQAGADWQRTITTAQQPTFALADGDEFAGRRISATVHHEAAAPMFEGSGHDVAALLETVKAGKTLPRFSLRSSVRAALRCSDQITTSENVVAVMEGGDRRLRNEYVVMTAHLDHVGQFGSGADTIYNGAMDNASGIASLIDAAARLRAAGTRLRRSVAFVAVTAEERGLLGSYAFAFNPALPRGTRMVANINLDMFLPIIPMKSLVGFGMEESSLQRDVEAAAASAGIVAERDPVPQMNVFIRSDQYNFVRAGVPSVMLMVGAAGDREIWKTWETWMATRYHQPSDDLKQPVDFESAETFQRAMLALLERVANADRRPRWNSTSPFR